MRTVLACLACLACLGCLPTAEVRVAPLFGHQDTVLAADFDDTQAATIDTRLRLWDLLDGRLLWMEEGVLPRPDAYVKPTVALGATVVIAMRRDGVRVFDRASGRLLWQGVAHGQPPDSDGRTVILSRSGMQSVLFDARDGSHLLDLPEADYRYSCRFLPDGGVLLTNEDRLRLATPTDGRWRLSEEFAAPPVGPEDQRSFLLPGPDGKPRLLSVHLRTFSEAEEAAIAQALEAGELRPPQDAVCRWWTLPPQAAPERELLVRGLGRLPDCVLPDGTLLTRPRDNWSERDMRIAPPGSAARLRPGSPEKADLLVGSRRGRRVLLASGTVASVEDADHGDSPLMQLRGPAAPPAARSLIRSSDGRRIAASTNVGVRYGTSRCCASTASFPLRARSRTTSPPARCPDSPPACSTSTAGKTPRSPPTTSSTSTGRGPGPMG